MTRPIDEKGKTSAKCARPGKEEVTSNPLSRVISRWESSRIAPRTMCRFNSISWMFSPRIYEHFEPDDEENKTQWGVKRKRKQLTERRESVSIFPAVLWEISFKFISFISLNYFRRGDIEFSRASSINNCNKLPTLGGSIQLFFPKFTELPGDA